MNSCHSPNGLQIAANDNEQLSFEFMDMAEAAVAHARGTEERRVGPRSQQAVRCIALY